MKHLYFKTILLCFCLLASVNVFAEAVEIDGIYYNLVTETKQAEVTENPNKYSGTVTIPESVTYNGVTYSVTSIGDYAFRLCSGLTSVTIGKGVKTIEYGAFSNCTELTDVYCYADSVPSTHRTTFPTSYIKNATLHVPAESIEQYNATAPWSNFGTIVAYLRTKMP